MILYDMQVFRDKNLGGQGDSLRACVATVLQCDPSFLPHFLSDPDSPNWHYSISRFLDQRGLWYIEVPNVGMHYQSILTTVYHLLIGKSSHSNLHAVVAKNGEIFHDPHPSRSGFQDPGVWGENLRAGFFIKTLV